MGNFNNVSMGSGVLFYDNVDVGFLKGDVQFSYNYDIEDFETGVPLVLQGSIVKKAGAMLKAGVAELTAANFSMALGGLAITNNNGAEDVTHSVNPQLLTFSAYQGGSIEAIVLDGPNVTTGANKPVLKDTTDTITYAENTDYIVDYLNGHIYRNPAGALTAGESVHVTYRFTAPQSQQIKLGATFHLAQKNLQFVHTMPNTGKMITIHMWKAQVTGKIDFRFSESSFIINDVEFKAIADWAGHPDMPFGYIEREL